MKDKAIKNKAKKELTKIQNLLKKASSGKDTGEMGIDLCIYDAGELIRYYSIVSSGNFKKAAMYQWDIDTDTRNFINDSVFNFIENFYDGE